LQSLRHDAQDGGGVAVGWLRLAPGNADVVGPGDAAADPLAAGVPEPGVIGGPPGHGQVERWIRQNERLPFVRRPIEPVAKRFYQSLAQGRGLKDAAVEEDGLRSLVRRLLRAVPLQKRRQMARDRRIADIR